jgi:hypothetical protein
MGRGIATIVNIGCDIARQGIAKPDDIDRAVTLGLSYTLGPLATGELKYLSRLLYGGGKYEKYFVDAAIVRCKRKIN